MNHKASIIFEQILKMDAEQIPYHAGNIGPRKQLMKRLNETGYSVGIGKQHRIVLRKLPIFNWLPPCMPIPGQ